MQLQTQSQLLITGLGATNAKVKLPDFWSIAWPGTALMGAPCTQKDTCRCSAATLWCLQLKLFLLPHQILELHTALVAPQHRSLGVPSRPVQSVPATCQNLSS